MDREPGPGGVGGREHGGAARRMAESASLQPRAALQLCGDRTVPRGHRDLRSDQLLGRAADGRAGHPARTGRAQCGCGGHGRS